MFLAGGIEKIGNILPWVMELSLTDKGRVWGLDHVCMCVSICSLVSRTPKKGCPFHYKDWNAKVGSQETPGVRGKFSLGVRNEARQRLTELCQENALIITNTLFQQHKRRLYPGTSPDGHTKIRLIISFAAKDGEALYSQQKQDWELTVAQIMNSLLSNSDLNWRKWGKQLDHSGMT